MHRRLLLTSQGIQPELEDVFLSCLGEAPERKRVSFITTAARGEGTYYPKWMDIYKKQLEGCGIKNIEEMDLKGKTPRDTRQALSDKEIIFVNGGNTFYLLHWARKSGFFELLPELLKEGKFYVGVSAGSYIVCPTIEAATWKRQDRNMIGLKDLTGLNLIPFLISAHFEEKYRPTIERAARNTAYPIVALYDTQAVLVEDSIYKVVGTGKREFFNGFKEG